MGKIRPSIFRSTSIIIKTKTQPQNAEKNTFHYTSEKKTTLTTPWNSKYVLFHRLVIWEHTNIHTYIHLKNITLLQGSRVKHIILEIEYKYLFSNVLRYI